MIHAHAYTDVLVCLSMCVQPLGMKKCQGKKKKQPLKSIIGSNITKVKMCFTYKQHERMFVYNKK